MPVDDGVPIEPWSQLAPIDVAMLVESGCPPELIVDGVLDGDGLRAPLAVPEAR